jgi:hypothetical protein
MIMTSQQYRLLSVCLLLLTSSNYSDLTVSQGTGSYSSHVIVQEKSTGDFLLILQNQSISNIDDNDFSAI